MADDAKNALTQARERLNNLPTNVSEDDYEKANAEVVTAEQQVPWWKR